MAHQPLLVLELNEVNFEYVRRYVAAGHLPTLGRLIARHGIIETTSETEYDHLEPWIQWVTAHTGLTFAEHGVYRLGDITKSSVAQTWETLERHGLRVAAVSPINGRNSCQAAPFFVPDPWTPTPVSGSPMIRALHAALVQTVGDNAQGRIAPKSLLALGAGVLRYGRMASWPSQLHRAARALKQPWQRAAFLDRFLADYFIQAWKTHRPDYATLFLNAAAHIQHHYMFSSSVYDGPHRNPAWYAPPGVDPLLEIYTAYDQVAADLLQLAPEARLMIATGLHQDPCPDHIFYYRIKEHAAFLRRLGVSFKGVLPLMSRDFTIDCVDHAQAEAAAQHLVRLRGPQGETLFYTDVRNDSVFAMFIHRDEIKGALPMYDGGKLLWDIADDVAFVAIKNGIHNGTGYLIDTANRSTAGAPPDTIPLKSLHGRVLDAFGVGSPAAASKAA